MKTARDDITAGGPSSGELKTLAPVRGAQRLARDELLERLVREVARARRYQRPLALVVLRLEHPRTQLPIVVRTLRAPDSVGQTGSDELCLVLPETDEGSDAAAQRVLAQLDVTARAGVARLGRDALDATGLLIAARAAATAPGERGERDDGASALELRIGDEAIVVADERMRQIYGLVRNLAASDVPVLVSGPTGAGKEMIARALHAWSPRAQASFVAFNCAAVAEDLLESELFGHEAGAFTGADKDKIGLLESAAGGTVLLDEIGEASPRAQAKLLRALETQRVRRVGALSERPIDVRFVAATNRDLLDEVAAGGFRADLYYRLAAAQVDVPPLRERRAEVLPLAERFLDAACQRIGRATPRLDPAVTTRLLHCPWPGNLRELRNAMDVVAAVWRDGPVQLDALPAALRAERATREHVEGGARAERPERGTSAGAAVADDVDAPPFRPIAEEVRELERRRMAEALEASDGVRKEAAALIGMPLRTFVTKLKRYELGR